MNSKPVIDLCESSADEREPNTNNPTTATADPVEPSINVNTHNQADSKVSPLPVAKAKFIGCFWDSSDDEPTPTPSRKDRERRRESKLVTPDGAQLKPSSLESHGGDDSSDEERQSFDYQQRSKRKQPRTLFSKSSKAASRAVRRTPKPKETSPSERATVTTKKNKSMKESSSWNLDDSSSDESVPFSTVFQKKKVGIPKANPIGSSNTSTKEDPVVLCIDSSDDEDGKLPAAKSPDVNIARGTTQGLPSSQAPLIVNPYSKRRDITELKNPLSSSSRTEPQHSLVARQILQYPRFGPSAGCQHDDIRAKCLLALWKHSRTLVSASYNLSKLDSYCRRIKDLALSTEFPIRSLTEYTGSGYSIESTALREALQAGGVDRIKTPHNRDVGQEGFFSIAEAALVSMLEHIAARAHCKKIDFNDETQRASFCCDKEQWVYLSDIIPEIDKRLNKELTPALLGRDDDDHGEMFYTNPNTRSAEYKQLEQLTKTDARSDMPLLKAHRKEKRVCFELTHRGLMKAQSIRNRRFPEAPGYLRTSKLHVDSVDPCFQGICLVVDNREGGGTSKRLHSMCQGLDIRKVPYIVTKLDIGDYAFVSMDTQKLIPIIIERKSIQDVAQSIWDGRWVSQKQRMYQGQNVLGFENSRLVYLIEGQADGQELTGGAMGQTRFNVSRAQLDTEVGNLHQEGFEVLTTSNVNGSLAKLVELSRSVAHDYRNGKLKASFTYEEFMAQARAIPRGIDFSRIARDHCARRTSNSVESFRAEEATETQTHIGIKSSEKEKCKNGEIANDNKYNGWKVSQLKEECEKYGLSKTGKKSELIARLLGPRPPEVWLERKKANLYVPAKYDTCASAILVSMWLHQRQQGDVNAWKGLEKEEIITLAESLKISKDPFTGTGKGLFNYDGWSCMGPLREGQSPLIWRQKGGFFKLTTVGGDISGYRIAEAMHDWCHAHQKCVCNEVGLP